MIIQVYYCVQTNYYLYQKYKSLLLLALPVHTVKVKVTLEQATKSQRRRRGIALLFL